MTENEFEIEKLFGASSFYIYQVLKYNPNSSLKDLECETGYSDRILKTHLKNLVECGIVERERKFLRYCMGYIYKVTKEQENWTLH